MANQRPILSIRDLHVHFSSEGRTVRAVNGLELDLYEGETLGVVGESGSGKSVTARAIMQLIPSPGRIAAGRITLNPSNQSLAQELTHLAPESQAMRNKRGKDIAMIFQEPMASLSPVHTIGSQILESVHLHLRLKGREARTYAIDLLDKVGIARPDVRIDSYPFELSGGMRQRAMIAMALAAKPRILLADEPTTALDVTIQAQILALLRRLQDESGMSIVLITHNLGVVAQVAQRVAVMYQGRVVEEAPADDLFERPKHPYTRGLIQSVPMIGRKRRRQLDPIKGSVPGPYTVIQGCPFHPRCPEARPGLCDTKMPATTHLHEHHQVRCFLHSDEVDHDQQAFQVNRHA